MLGKLIKHEFKGTYKTFGLLYLALLALTLLTRFCVYIPFDNAVYELLNGLLSIFYVVAVFGITLASIIVVIMRFNRNMLRDEGYLTHTLPVKAWQHLLAKGITYMVWLISSIIVMFTSLFLFFVGTDEFTDFMEGFGKVLNEIGEYPKLVGLIVLCVVIFIVQMAVNLFNFFAALSLGQIFTKHKIFGAVLFYFVLNYAMSFLLSGVTMFIPNLVNDMNNMTAKLEAAKTVTQIVDAISGPLYIFFIVSLVVDIVLGVVYFFISNYMISKKLNLE